MAITVVIATRVFSVYVTCNRSVRNAIIIFGNAVYGDIENEWLYIEMYTIMNAHDCNGVVCLMF